MILGQSAKLNVRQSMFAVKLPKLMSTECTTPIHGKELILRSLLDRGN